MCVCVCISCSLNIGGVTFTAESLMGIQPWPWRVAAALSILPSFTQHLPNRTWHGDGSPKWSLRPKVAEPQTAEATVEAAEARKDGFVSSDGDLFGWWDGYGSIPIDTFLAGWTSIYQLFWGSLGTRVLTHPQILKVLWCVDIAVAIAGSQLIFESFCNMKDVETVFWRLPDRWERWEHEPPSPDLP